MVLLFESIQYFTAFFKDFDATESAFFLSVLHLEGLALVEGVAGATGGVDARGEPRVAAGHVGVVRGSVVAEGIGGAPADGNVGGSLDLENRPFTLDIQSEFGVSTACLNLL